MADDKDVPISGDGRPDYLAYLARSRQTLTRAIVTSAGLAVIAGLRIAYVFSQSASQGSFALVAAAYVVVGGVAVVFAAIGIAWVPAAIRILVLKARIPKAKFYLAKPIPGLWSGLDAVDQRHNHGTRLQNATLSVDDRGATLWRGIVHPRIIAVLPLERLSAVETDRFPGTPFRRRLIVLTFKLDKGSEEVPLALRRVYGFGYVRLSAAAQGELVKRLLALRAQA